MTDIAGIDIGHGDKQPTEPGLYVVYINDYDVPHFTYAKRELMMWMDGRWSYRMSDQRFRGHVYQWLGPLPALKLED